jgi:TatD DNase family protein
LVPDSHAHLDLIELEPERVVSQALASGVRPIITIGITLESSREAVRLAESIGGVYAAVGIHPNDSGGVGSDDFDELERIAGSSDRVVAIGETGLDYYRDRTPPEAQQAAFRAHARLAHRIRKPLIVHDRQAHSDVMRILGEDQTGDTPVVMHCFSGGEDVLEECLRRGYYISFAGPVTFKKADAAREAAARTPPDRLLAETDSPFLSPEPFRGKPNLPERVRFVADELARLHGIPSPEMESILTENTAAVFGLAESGGPR